MALSSDLTSQFAKVVNSKKLIKESTVSGTVVEYAGKKYVQLDGSDQYTPIATTAEYEVGERVTVMIKNHTAMVTGNMSSPSARSTTVETIKNNVLDVANIVANKADINVLEAEIARIDNLTAENVVIKDQLTAENARIENLEATNVDVTGRLTASEAEIETLKTTKIDAESVEADFLKVNGQLEATNAKIYNLEATYGDFVDLTTQKFEATDATIKNLDAKYANIDFSNIDKAAMEYFYANSGLINNVVIGDATISGELVGVTIKGDLIEGNTIVADKLVIKGTDGLYYKLNTDGIKTEAEQTDYNSLNGQVIKAKSITATKIDVKDLVAFDATIGGFHITDDSIYSGVKKSVDNTTRGIYMDNDGQIAVGDANNYIRYYKDQNGNYKLAISAEKLTFGVNNKTIDKVVMSCNEEFYRSSSPTSLIGGSWSVDQPTWTENTYIWRRTKITYGDETFDYEPSENGVCITGNTGPQGESGKMFYGICSTAAATKAKTVTIEGFSLYTGVVVSIKFTVTNTATSPTLNVNDTGSINIYYRGSAITPSYLAANRTYIFVYSGSRWEFIGDINVNTDTYDRIRYYQSIKAGSTAISSGNIIVAESENAGTYKHLKLGTVFDVSYPILYASSSISANSTGMSNYLAIPFTVTTTQSITLTAYKAVYIKGTLSGTSFTPVSTTPLTQEIPTTNDGYQYIFLGTAYSTTGMYLLSEHPIFQYFDGGFKSVEQIAIEAAKTATNYMNFDSEGLVVGDMTADTLGKNVLIDSDGIDIRDNKNVLASFTESLIELGKNAATSVITLCGGVGKIMATATESGSNFFDRLWISARNLLLKCRSFDVTASTQYDNYEESFSDSAYSTINASSSTSSSGNRSATAFISASKKSNSVKSMVTTRVSDGDKASIELTATDSDGTAYYTFGSDSAYIRKDLYIYNSHVYLDNAKNIYATGANGFLFNVFTPKNANNDTVIGYDNYMKGSGNTNIYGNDVLIYSKEANIYYRPYYRKGDSVTFDVYTAGFVTNSNTEVWFTVPLSRPVIGSPTVVPSTVNGFILREGNKYTHGSGASAYAKPSSYTGWLYSTNDGVTIRAIFSNTTNSVNNSPIGVRWSGKITFS